MPGITGAEASSYRNVTLWNGPAQQRYNQVIYWPNVAPPPSR